MKKFIRTFAAVLAAKTVLKAVKFLNIGSGTNLPGRIALKISPDILSAVISKTNPHIICVTGTNGKTTTSGFISSIYAKNGSKVVSNKFGANMLTGIISSVIENCSLLGNLNAEVCVFECDEAYLEKIFDFITPDYLIVTNLFRDQLDRYGELETTAQKIRRATEKTAKVKPLTLLLNADDPLVARITNSKNIEKLYFGIKDVKNINDVKNVSSPPEASVCECGNDLLYSKNFYGQLGQYYCTCGKKHPVNNFEADVTVLPDSSDIVISGQNNTPVSIKLKMPGLYNVYNALAATALCLSDKIGAEVITAALEDYSTVFGRSEELVINGKKVLIQLIKNPVGASEVLKTAADDKNSRMLIMINDNYADGRDVSWLWDADFELIANHGKPVVTSGVRASDMAVRLKYAGIASENIVIEENINKALNTSLNMLKENEKLYVLPTYTALLSLDRILRKYKGC